MPGTGTISDTSRRKLYQNGSLNPSKYKKMPVRYSDTAAQHEEPVSLTPEKWFSDLASECAKDLLRFLMRRVTNQAEAEDLAQEVYVRLLRVTDVGRIRSRCAFALRVAANVAHEWRMLARNRLPHS